MARSRYPRVFGSAAAKAQSRAVFAAVGGVTPTPTPMPALLNSGILRLFGAQTHNTAASVSADGASGLGRAWVNKLQVPGGAIGAKLILYNPSSPLVEMRNIRASIAITERGAIDTVDNAYSVWSGGTKHNAAAPGDPLGFQRFTWAGGTLTWSPVVPRPNSVLPSFGYNNQHTYVVSDAVMGLSPVRATDRTKEEYYAIFRLDWDQLGGDGQPVVTTAAFSAAQNVALTTDRADYPLQTVGRCDPSSGVTTPNALPSDLSLLADSPPCMAIEWIYPAGTKAMTIWGVGDSITESYRWWQIGVWRNSTPALPVHVYNIGGSTTRTESYLGNMWAALQALTRPDFVLLPTTSINNYSPSSDFTMDKAMNVEWPRTKATIDALNAEGIGVILWTSYNYGSDADPTTPIGYVNDQARKYVAQLNSKFLWLCDITRAPNFSRTVYNASTNPGGWIDPDNTHPSNPTGIQGMALALQLVIAQIKAMYA